MMAILDSPLISVYAYALKIMKLSFIPMILVIMQETSQNSYMFKNLLCALKFFRRLEIQV